MKEKKEVELLPEYNYIKGEHGESLYSIYEKDGTLKWVVSEGKLLYDYIMANLKKNES